MPAVEPGSPAWRPRRRQAAGALVLVLLTSITLVMLFPFLWMIVTSLTPNGQATSPEFRLWPADPTLENYVEAFTGYPLLTWIRNSVVISVLGALLSVTVSLMAGYAFAKFRFRGRTTFFLAYLLTIMVPIQVTLVPTFLVAVNLGLVNSIWGVILPGAAEATGVFIARQFMMSIPDELMEAARLDGAGEIRTFCRIVLPLSGPLVAVLAVLAVTARWNEFLWPFVILQGDDVLTLPVGLASLQGGDLFSTPWGTILAITTIAVLPVLIVFLVFQRQFVQGIAGTGSK
ncbi:carbohydrate ABC transporter permease [Saccharopolyspora erythraea]|uniref:carbohydrate ABC transporter permease n=1 Tax=Saccharopolyspora erythraea TaxID=1836 RepID=UPI001BA7ADA4|nr:carbohydrate ABC transporter permease [Saccharopolyspora erythraea]